MTALTDALELAIAAQKDLNNAQAAFDAAQLTLNDSLTNLDSARSAAFAFLPPEIVCYAYTNLDGEDWVLWKDNNPTITLRILNELPTT